MARMFPDTLDGRNPTPGEARVFAHLKRVLPGSEHWAWYEPTLRVKRGKSPEPDFVLVGPGYGVMVLEVKDWGRGAVRGADASTMTVREAGGREERHTHPLKQAQRAAYALKERFESVPGLTHPAGKYQGKSVVPVNWGVVYPNLRRRDLDEMERRGVPVRVESCLAAEDLERDDEEGTRRLLGALERMAGVAFAFTLDDPLRDRIRTAIEPQLHFFDFREPGAPKPPSSSPAPPSASPEASEGRTEAPRVTRAPLPELYGHWLDRKQERMARELASPRTLVYGPAGCGKTVFLTARAQYWLDRRPESRVLFTCYNASLASHLRNVFALKGLPPDGERLTVLHYHDLCGHILGRDDIHERPEGFYATLEPKVLQELARRDDVPAYDLILVDEGQDFTRRMLEVLVRLAAPGGEITVVCDPAQDIYGRWSEDNLAPFRSHGTERLVDCYRNTAPIFALALAVLSPETRAAMGLERLELTKPQDLGRDGPAPELVALDGLDALVSVIHEAVQEFDREGRDLSELAVLYPGRESIPNFPGRLRHSRWVAAGDPRFTIESDAGEPAADPTQGTLVPDDDRDGAAAAARPHFAEALEAELLARNMPVEWVARDFASKAAYDISRSRLTLSTIHSAKGMDFHTVILLGAESLSTRPGRDRERSAALLFTGVTRARERLVIPYFLDRGWVPEIRERLDAIEEDVGA